MTDQTASNPLSKYFRKPAIYIKLPSGGRWWTDDAIEMPVIGELPVYPMTTKDEITLRTPDALLNGQGVVDVIQSCVPNIRNAWHMPSVDVDAVLIAIRIASYGNNLNFESECPHCKEENVHEIDLGNITAGIQCPDYSRTLNYLTLKIKLHPQKYYTVNRVNQLGFEQQRLENALAATADSAPDIRAANIKEIMDKISDIGLTSITESTEYIETESGDRITNKDFIKEFYQNAELAVVDMIQGRLSEIAKEVQIPDLQLLCNECQQEYSIALTFDYANFFGKGF